MFHGKETFLFELSGALATRLYSMAGLIICVILPTLRLPARSCREAEGRLRAAHARVAAANAALGARDAEMAALQARLAELPARAPPAPRPTLRLRLLGQRAAPQGASA